MVKKKLFKIIGMHCSSCAMNIDGELEDTKGVVDVNTNYVKEETLVSYEESILTPNDIINSIKKAGYDARLTTNSPLNKSQH